jgi:hypothetical protein
MAKIDAMIPEPAPQYDPSNQRQIQESLTTIKQQLNTSYQHDLMQDQQLFNWFIS